MRSGHVIGCGQGNCKQTGKADDFSLLGLKSIESKARKAKLTNLKSTVMLLRMRPTFLEDRTSSHSFLCAISK
jgi:hypothetical protein